MHDHIWSYMNSSAKTLILHFSTSSGNRLISGYLVGLFPTSSSSLFLTSSAWVQANRWAGAGGRTGGRASGWPGVATSSGHNDLLWHRTSFARRSQDKLQKQTIPAASLRMKSLDLVYGVFSDDNSVATVSLWGRRRNNRDHSTEIIQMPKNRQLQRAPKS